VCVAKGARRLLRHLWRKLIARQAELKKIRADEKKVESSVEEIDEDPGVEETKESARRTMKSLE